MKVQYIAEDGKMFDNEDDCTDYEYQCMVKSLAERVGEKLLMWDEQLQSIPTEKLLKSPECCLNDVKYIYIADMEAAELLNKVNTDGFTMPMNLGFVRTIPEEIIGMWHDISHEQDYESIWQKVDKKIIDLLSSELALYNKFVQK